MTGAIIQAGTTSTVVASGNIFISPIYPSNIMFYPTPYMPIVI
jgi:hypothetical protein